MSVRANLGQRLLTVWNGEPWHGPSSRTVLHDVTAEEAAAHPLRGAPSIWEIVLRMSDRTEEVTRRVGGAAARAPARDDRSAATDTSPEAWIAAQAALLAARRALLAAIEAAHEEDLYLKVPPSADGTSGPTYSRSETAGGLADHDIHSLGQIELLTKALRTGL